jgi:tRNA (cmo5U34)-methyltransferase
MQEQPVLDLGKHFGGERASEYDEGIRRRIPGYETLHATAQAVLESQLPPRARLLVVGCGTGREIVAYAKANPGWALVGVDPSADMIAIAEKKVAAAAVGDRVELRGGTVSAVAASENFDAATALLVMHFLADDGSKESFLSAIAERLNPGAPLVLADMTGMPGTLEFETIIEAWKAYWSRTYEIAADDPGMLKEFAERRARSGWADDRRHAELFAATGFGPPVLFWKGLLFSAWVTRKS